MAQYEFVGTVKEIKDTQTFSSGFFKRELVVTSEDERFPQDILFEFLKEKATVLDSISASDRVKVFFDLRGREYNGRYFNSLIAWKLEMLDSRAELVQPSKTEDSVSISNPDDISVEDEDNLPF